MPCSSLVLSKFHGLKNSSTNKNAKLDAEAVPILSLDVGLFEEGKVCKVLTSGADNVIRIWQFDSSRCSVSHVNDLSELIRKTTIECQNNPEKQESFKKIITENQNFSSNWFTFLSELVRHEKSVNAAKYSPNKKLIASASDDNNVILWKQVEKAQNVFGFSSLDKSSNNSSDKSQKPLKFKEHWQANRVCSGHSQDVISISWCGNDYLYTCGMDYKVQGFSITEDDNGLLKVQKVLNFEDEKCKIIQGLVTTLDLHVTIAFCSDGHLVYFNKNKKLKHTINDKKLFCADNMHPSMFRKADFSPDGLILATAAGCLRKSNGQFQNFCCHFYLRTKIFNFEEPVVSIPTTRPVVGCTWNNFVKFEFGFVICVYTIADVLIYRWNQFVENEPIIQLAYKFENLHYEQLTDAIWVDPATLLISSRDGFMNVIQFDLQKDFGKSTNFTLTSVRDPTKEPTIKSLEFTEHDLSRKPTDRANHKKSSVFIEDCSKNWEHNVEFNLDDLNDTTDEEEDSPGNSPKTGSGNSANQKSSSANKNLRRSTRKNFGKVSEAMKRQRELEKKKNGPSWLDQTFGEDSDESEEDKDFNVSSSSEDNDEETTQEDDTNMSTNQNSDESGQNSGSEEESDSSEDDSSGDDEDSGSDISEQENMELKQNQYQKSTPRKVESLNPFSKKIKDPSNVQSTSKIIDLNEEPYPYKSTSKSSANKENIQESNTMEVSDDECSDDDFVEKAPTVSSFNSPRINSAVKQKINDFGGAKQPPPPQVKPKPRKIVLTTLK